MINRDDIEAGDKCYTRDGGCLVAWMSDDGYVMLGDYMATDWFIQNNSKPHEILIRIEKASKPVVTEVYVGMIDSEHGASIVHPLTQLYPIIIKLTIINGKLEKSEQVK